MLKWIRSRFGSAHREEPQTRIAVSSPTTRPPLYYLDVDESNRLFVRYIHVTSSVNRDSIFENGLRPLQEVRSSLVAFLENFFPSEDAGALLFEIERTSDMRHGSLVRMRLDDEASGRWIVSMLPLGAKHYLREAANNAVADGGKVYRAARMAANALLHKSVAAPFPDATPRCVYRSPLLARRASKFGARRST